MAKLSYYHGTYKKGRVIFKIFINYRTEDSGPTAGRLHAELRQAFGSNISFMTVGRGIPAGMKFEEYLTAQLSTCDYFLALIGPNWLDVKDKTGKRRLEDPDDWVVKEIAAALKRQIIPVVPVLVDGTSLPLAHELPDQIKELASRQAREVRNKYFHEDAPPLIDEIRPLVRSKQPWLVRAIMGVFDRLSERWIVVAAGVLAGLFLGTLINMNVFSSQPWFLPSWGTFGEIKLTGPDELVFAGPQSGTFSPPRLALELSAVGEGFHWSLEGVTPKWLAITPDQGNLTMNGSVEISIALTPAAQAISPGQYRTSVTFRNASSGKSAARAVRLDVAPKPGNLTIVGPDVLKFAGSQGGSFTPSKIDLTLKVVGPGFHWALDGPVPAWFNLNPTQGDLAENGSVEVSIVLTAVAQTLSQGEYLAPLTFKFSDAKTISRGLTLYVAAASGDLRIVGPELEFAGRKGGPFIPPKLLLKLNAAGPSFAWSIDGAIPKWLNIDPNHGNLPADGSAEITISPNSAAQLLSQGEYDASLTFKNLSTGKTTGRPIKLAILPNSATAAAYVPYKNRDIMGFDLQRKDNSDLASCELACSGNDKCIAYSFDKWNRTCFLKWKIIPLRIDPHSITGVRGDQGVPAMRTDPPKMRPLLGREFPETGYSTVKADFEKCNDTCEMDDKCIAFTLLKTERRCTLFSETGEYFKNPKFDSGYKEQP